MLSERRDVREGSYTDTEHIHPKCLQCDNYRGKEGGLFYCFRGDYTSSYIACNWWCEKANNEFTPLKNTVWVQRNVNT
jgi:hypothetical protein